MSIPRRGAQAGMVDAATEQELYDRLPGVLAYLSENATVPFDIRSNHTIHNITFNRELFAKKAASYFDDVRNRIATLLKDKDLDQPLPPLVLAHRFSQLPGVRAFLSALGQPRAVVLKSGFSALNVLYNIDHFGGQAHGKDADYFTSRPWQPTEVGTVNPAVEVPVDTPTPIRPTHLLYRDLAYPITRSPICIGIKEPLASGTLQIGGGYETDGQQYCTVQLLENRVLLTVFRPGDTLVDNEPVDKESALSLGQTIRVGESGDTIRLIACLDTHET